MTTRNFPLADILSVTTPHLLSHQGMAGLTDLLNWMTGDQLETWQLHRAADAAKPALIAQHPFLADLLPPGGLDKPNLYTWLLGVEARYGAELPVAELAGWVSQDPMEEFVDRVELARLRTTRDDQS